MEVLSVKGRGQVGVWEADQGWCGPGEGDVFSGCLVCMS